MGKRREGPRPAFPQGGCAPRAARSAHAPRPAPACQTASPAGDGAGLLERVKKVPVFGEADISVGPNHTLKVIATPTPRWPDLMVVYDPASKVVFTSKLYSAHVAPGVISDEVSGVLRGGSMVSSLKPRARAAPRGSRPARPLAPLRRALALPNRRLPP